MQRTGAIVGIAVLGMFVVLLAYGLISKAPDTTIDSGLADAKAPPAPAFELDVLDDGAVGPRLDRARRATSDGRVSLTELRGQPVVLNFWASWCPPCREEAPRLEHGWRSMRTKGVLFLGLDMQDLEGDARDFIREFDLTYPQVRDGGDDVARDWGVTGLPETFFITADGRVVAHVIGAVSKQQLDDGIRAAVAGQPLEALEGGDRRPTR